MKKHILVLVIVLSMLISLQLGGTVSAKALPSPYRDISLAQEHVEFNRIGDIKTLRVYILGQNISHYEVEWASSDEQVVEVLNDNTGSVNISSLYANEYTDIEAVGDGQATITAKVSIWESGSGVAGVATSSNSNAVGSEMEEVYEFECDVTVDTSASGVVITTKEIVITSKKKAYPIGYLNYTDTSDSLLSFISENDDIAYTANTRSVSGRHNGEVTVVLKTPDGVYYDTCQVVVDFPEINGLYYEIQDDNTVVIIGYDGIDSEVVIPDEIEGMPVVAIRIFAFFGEQNLESVIIGDYVVDIGESAFMLCENLKYVKLGEAVKTIHGKGFAVCSQLEEINFPDSLEYIKEYAFADCISLETFIIPENAKEVQISLPGHLTGSVKIINLSKLGFTNYQLAQLSDAYYSSNYDEWYSLPMGGEQLTSLASGGTAYRQYPILYHTRNNHVGDNPVRHGIESDVILNPIPDQIIDEVTYRFEGWYMDEQYTQKISKIERTLREPITLYAKQTPKTASKNSSDSDSSKSEVNYQQNNYLAKVNTSPAQTDGIVVNQGNWKQQGDNWSFVDINGQLVKSRWVFDQERWYFIDQNGIMVTGWMMVDGHWYLLYQDGAMIIGWKYVNGQWYYMKEHGEMATGWILVKQKYYYLDASGALLTNTTTPDGYRVNSSGVWIS